MAKLRPNNIGSASAEGLIAHIEECGWELKDKPPGVGGLQAAAAHMLRANSMLERLEDAETLLQALKTRLDKMGVP